MQVDGMKNARVQSIFLEDLPIHKAAFANGGSQVALPPPLPISVILTWMVAAENVQLVD